MVVQLDGVAKPSMLAPIPSDRHNPEGGIESPKIIGIGGDDLLAGAASADHNVSIHNIRRSARSK